MRFKIGYTIGGAGFMPSDSLHIVGPISLFFFEIDDSDVKMNILLLGDVHTRWRPDDCGDDVHTKKDTKAFLKDLLDVMPEDECLDYFVEISLKDHVDVIDAANHDPESDMNHIDRRMDTKMDNTLLMMNTIVFPVTKLVRTHAIDSRFSNLRVGKFDSLMLNLYLTLARMETEMLPEYAKKTFADDLAKILLYSSSFLDDIDSQIVERFEQDLLEISDIIHLSNPIKYKYDTLTQLTTWHNVFKKRHKKTKLTTSEIEACKNVVLEMVNRELADSAIKGFIHAITLIQDIYTIFRLFTRFDDKKNVLSRKTVRLERSTCETQFVKNAFIYIGDAHAQNVTRIIQAIKGMTPTISIPSERITNPRFPDVYSYKKCIRLNESDVNRIISRFSRK